jgi:hypothetical protein
MNQGWVSVVRNRFQSPCAGNMFGKLPKHNRLVRLKFEFQSPCAGNMFGKGPRSYAFPHEQARGADVSIPVCGEHVW